MKTGTRVLAVVALLVAAAMLVCSMTAGIGIWFVRAPTVDCVSALFGRIESALELAGQGLTQVKATVRRATERLNEVSDEQRQLAREPQKDDRKRQLLAKKVQQRLAPLLGDSYGKLQRIAEAAAVVNSVLKDVGDFPGLRARGLEMDQLEAINGQLARVSSSTWELSRLLGAPAPTTGHDPVDHQLSRVEQALHNTQTLLASYEPQLALVHEETATLKACALHWITAGTTGMALVCYWIAISQAVVMARVRCLLK